jgi:hypothetical protein
VTLTEDEAAVKTGTEHVAVKAMAPVDVAGEVFVYSLEAGAEVWPRGLDENVKVVRELAVRHDAPFACLDLFGEQAQVALPVAVVVKEQSARRRLCGDVVHAPSELDPHPSWHLPH